jgi:hypothetical protein
MDALTRRSAWMTPYAVVWVVGLAVGVAGCKGNQGGQTLPPPVESERWFGLAAGLGRGPAW